MKKVFIFLAVCFGLSILSAGAFHLLGGEYASIGGVIFASAYMLIPLISVVITQLVCNEKPLRNCGVNWKINRWWFVAWLGMPLLTAIAILSSVLSPGVDLSLDTPLMQASIDQLGPNGPQVGPWGVIAITLFSGLMSGATINALFAFGEEVAWRGFLARELSGLGFWKKSLLIGALWGVWHAPIILMGHNYPDHPVAGVFMMIAFCMLLSPIFMYVREKSGSVIVAAVAHGTMNAVAGLSLVLLTNYNDLLCGLCGVAGFAVLAVVDAVIACGDKSFSWKTKHE